MTEDLIAKHDEHHFRIRTSHHCNKLSQKFADSVVTSTLGRTASVKRDTDVGKIWNINLDAQISEIYYHFQENTYGIMRTTTACLPGTTTLDRQELLKPTCRLYGLAVGDAEFTAFIQHLN